MANPFFDGFFLISETSLDCLKLSRLITSANRFVQELAVQSGFEEKTRSKHFSV